MIGRGYVTVSADRNGQPWQGPLNPNPGLDTDAAGWGLTAYSPGGVNVPVWQSGGVYYPPQALGASAAARNSVGVARPGAGLTYRVSATVRVESLPAVVSLQVCGGNANNTLDATTTLKKWTFTASGVYDIEATGKLPAATDAMPYRYVRILREGTATDAPGALWLDRATLDWYNTAFAPVDVSCLVDSLSIKHGRDDTTSQPDASTVTLDCSWLNSLDTLPGVVEIGAGLFVDVEYPPGSGTLYRRFAGRITDVDLGWDDAGEESPDSVVGQIIAAGYTADLGSRVVGDAPFPQELDGARVSRVLGLAGITTDPATSDPGTVQIIARDIDSQPALDVARQTAESAGGLVWETRSGDVRYSDAEHRRGMGVSLALDACDLLITPQWVRNKDGLVNSVSIGYGVAADGGEQPRYTNTRPDSIDKYGTYALSATTQLATLADATQMGSLLLTRNGSPVWIFEGLPIDVGGLDAERTAALLSLDIHDLLSVTGLPSAGSAPTTATLWVEGWSETLAWGEHEIVVAVSGYCRTSPPPRWDDVNPAWTWDTVSPSSLTWDDAACFGPPVDYGRWNDVPASLRWDQIDPVITWDTWKV